MGDVVGEAGISTPKRWTIFAYVGTLVFILPFTGIANTTISLVLKDRLHLGSDAVAGFWFLANIPGYFGFLAGILRDRWAPFGRKDQGILVVFSLVTFLLFMALIGGPTTFAFLLAVGVGRSVAGHMRASAQQGLTSSLGKEYAMTGRMSALWQAAGYLPGVFISLIGGYLADHLTPRQTFLVAGLVALGIVGFCLWRPRVIYEDPVEKEPLRADALWRDAREVIRSPGVLPCVLLLFLWNFTPGVGTPVLFYLTTTLHGTPTQFGEFDAIFNASFVPTFLLHGFLCTRIPLRRILWISTIIAVPQILPLVLVHSAASVLWVAVPMGLMGGLATAAYFDLLMRACPPGLQGTAMMLGSSVWLLSNELGNVTGSKIYSATHSFPLCAYTTVLVYACLLVVLPFVPRSLTGTRDGERLEVDVAAG